MATTMCLVGDSGHPPLDSQETWMRLSVVFEQGVDEPLARLHSFEAGV